MKITAIKQQVKRADRYSIYVDEKYSFSFGESELLASHLRLNQELSQQELEELRNKAVLDKAYDRSLNLISRRQRSEWELAHYLRGKEYEPGVIEATCSRLRERGYLNDAKFAGAWIRNRRMLKPTSKRRLSQELRAKRVSDEVIAEALGLDETDEMEVLRELVLKKRKLLRFHDDQKLMQYLARQGYSFDDIKSSLRGED